MLRPDYDPVEIKPLYREKQFNQVSNQILSAIRDHSRASILVKHHKPVGGTLLVNKVIAYLEKEYQDDFRTVRINGANVDIVSIYGCIAEQLDITTDVACSDWISHRSDRELVLEYFQHPRTKGRLPTLLFIDEIDQGPRSEIRMLMIISKLPKSSLILIGTGSDDYYLKLLQLETSEMPTIITLENYTGEQLINIFASRTDNLFDRSALNLIAEEALCNAGCVAFGISILKKCLENEIKNRKSMGVVKWQGM